MVSDTVELSINSVEVATSSSKSKKTNRSKPQADLVISYDFLKSAKISAAQLAVEIAIYLYEQKKLTLGQAKRLANLDQLHFQKELALRNISIHYDMEDVLTDLRNLDIQL
jgi:predicted HTH domain antitoxin